MALNATTSQEAIDLVRESDVIDLHVDAFIWVRTFGYNLHRRNSPNIFGGAFYSQVDIPRIREGQLDGATWVITTNPLRRSSRREEVFTKNLTRIKADLESAADHVQLVRNAADFRRAKALGKHAAFLGIQGGNALDTSLDSVKVLESGDILRVTLVHLSNSKLGTTSAPSRKRRNSGLTDVGREYVQALNSMRVAVDLAHINRQGFFDALEVHDKSQPIWVTHTGVAGVRPHWRNIDDEQIRAVAETGGVVGVIYAGNFLSKTLFRASCEDVVLHLEHIIKVGGEDLAALGSDWDGLIIPPRDLQNPLDLPNLVQVMLDRKWSTMRIEKVLGQNFLHSLEHLRG